MSRDQIAGRIHSVRIDNGVSSWLGKMLSASVGILRVVTNSRLLMEGRWTESFYVPQK